MQGSACMTPSTSWVHVASTVVNRKVCAHPAACQADVHWTTALTSRLSDSVKLVGSTISCGSTFRGETHRSPSLTCPHVQSYALATDQAGLQARPPQCTGTCRGDTCQGFAAAWPAAIPDAMTSSVICIGSAHTVIRSLRSNCLACICSLLMRESVHIRWLAGTPCMCHGCLSMVVILASRV